MWRGCGKEKDPRTRVWLKTLSAESPRVSAGLTKLARTYFLLIEMIPMRLLKAKAYVTFNLKSPDGFTAGKAYL